MPGNSKWYATGANRGVPVSARRVVHRVMQYANAIENGGTLPA
jgi:hypothetical protein